MPDKDLFQMTFAPGWRRVYRMAEGGMSSESEIGEACITALAASLRESMGCPGFSELVAILDDVMRERRSHPLFAVGHVLSLSRPLASVRQVEARHRQQRVTKIAARVAMMLLTQHETVTVGARELSQELAERVCEELVNHHLFGRGRNYLVQRRFGTFEKEQGWEQAVKMGMRPSLAKLAAALAHSPHSAGFRAPKRGRVRMATHEILNEPIM